MYMLMDYMYSIYVNNVCLNLQKVPWGRVYIFLTDLFTEATMYRQQASPQPWKFSLRSHQKQSQRLKFSWGSMPTDPPSLRKSMSSIIFLANEKEFEVHMYYYSPRPLARQLLSLPPPPLMKILNETLSGIIIIKKCHLNYGTLGHL